MKHKPYFAIKGYMIIAGVSYEMLSKKLGITTRTLQNKIQGRSDFSTSEGKELSEILGVSQDRLFTERIVDTSTI